jgi:hypothetical protein
MKEFKIHIFCQKREICSLIKKQLRNDGYDVECTNLAETEEGFIDSFNKSIDCVILDKDIDSHIREKIRTKFSGIPMVCLPYLDADTSDNEDVTYISEPLKISELSEIIKAIRLKREVEAES